MRALLVVVGLTGCITITSKRVAPGVLREDWAEPRRDPDPFADPTRVETGNPWADDDDPSTPPTPTSARREVAERTAATILAVVAGGWTPLLVLSGTFEETPVRR